MRTQEIILRSMVFGLGAVATFAFVITKIPAALVWATSRSYDYGDLYRFAKIDDFKPAQLLQRGALDGIDSIDAGRLQPGQNDIIYLGDSFSFSDWGNGPFTLQLQRKLGLPLYSVYNNHHSSPWWNPYPYLSSPALRTQFRRTVAYEIVERSLENKFGEPQQPAEPGSSALSRIKDDILKDTELKTQGLLDNSNLTFPIISIWDTFLFHAFGRITPETPQFSLKPPFLFYKGEVQCFEAIHSDEMIARLADNISTFSDHLKNNLNENLVFIPIPNKITVYSHLVKEKPYDDFMPRLCAALQKRGVNTVELLPALRQQSQLLYWPSDTHWNNAAIQIAVDRTVENWPRQ